MRNSNERASPFTTATSPTTPPQRPVSSPRKRIDRRAERAKLAVGPGSARTTKATAPFPQGRPRGRGDTVGRTRPSSDRARPPRPKGRQADGTARARTREPRDRGRPGRPPETNGMDGAGGSRVRTDAGHATPSRGRRIAHDPGIAPPDPVRLASRRRRGRGTGPLSCVGTLALQRGEPQSSGTFMWNAPPRVSTRQRWKPARRDSFT